MKQQHSIGLALALWAGGTVNVAATNPPMPRCNMDAEATGAQFVTYDSGAGSLSCGSIYSPNGAMSSASVTANCNGVTGCTISATTPFDAVVIGTSGQSCIYMFRDALAAGALTGPNASFRFACSDGVVAEDNSDQPITSLNGGCAGDTGDFSLIQTAVSNTENVDWVFGVGDTGDQNDKTGLCVEGGTNDLARCDEQCVTPKNSTTYPYDPEDPVCATGTVDGDGTTIFPLQCRPCALTEEVAPPDGSPAYCWERSHQRAVFNEQTNNLDFKAYFIPVKLKSQGSLHYVSFEGSTCYQVKTTYRGSVLTYWTPQGCPTK